MNIDDLLVEPQATKPGGPTLLKEHQFEKTKVNLKNKDMQSAFRIFSKGVIQSY